MSSKFTEENNASLRRLEVASRSLSDEDLALETPYGWTVGALFAHMAWWEKRVTVLLRRWKEGGIDEAPVDSEMINESLKPLCHTLAPRAAIQLCLDLAREANAEIAATPLAQLEEFEASPNFIRFNRSLHRNGHLDDIVALLDAK
jgi:hypothetical protein